MCNSLNLLHPSLKRGWKWLSTSGVEKYMNDGISVSFKSIGLGPSSAHLLLTFSPQVLNTSLHLHTVWREALKKKKKKMYCGGSLLARNFAKRFCSWNRHPYFRAYDEILGCWDQMILMNYQLQDTISVMNKGCKGAFFSS